MSRRPPISTRTDSLFPYTTLFRSMLSNASIAFAIDNILEHTIAAKAHEVLFSYLPLAHLMERIFGEAMGLAVGAEMHFLEKPEALAETLARVSPTRFSGVRSEERRVGNECVSKWSSRWSPDH